MSKLTELSFSELESMADKLKVIMEECEYNSAKYQEASSMRRKCGFAMIDKYQENMNTIKSMVESGEVEKSYLEDTVEETIDYYNKAVNIAVPYYMESVTGTSIKAITAELAAYGTKLFPKSIASVVGKALTLPLKTFIMQRLSKYNLLYPECISFKQLDVESYTLSEAMEKFKLKPKFADKWQNSAHRVDVKVYSYNKKPVIAIAYTKSLVGIDGATDVETFMLDSKFKKYEDYYVACMATNLQLTHPAAGRVLKDMKEKWKKEESKQMKAITESSIDAEIHGCMDEKLGLIQECVQFELMDKETADNYTNILLRSQMMCD